MRLLGRGFGATTHYAVLADREHDRMVLRPRTRRVHIRHRCLDPPICLVLPSVLCYAGQATCGLSLRTRRNVHAPIWVLSPAQSTDSSCPWTFDRFCGATVGYLSYGLSPRCAVVLDRLRACWEMDDSVYEYNSGVICTYPWAVVDSSRSPRCRV